jgi:hypothetical protein
MGTANNRSGKKKSKRNTGSNSKTGTNAKDESLAGYGKVSQEQGTPGGESSSGKEIGTKLWILCCFSCGVSRAAVYHVRGAMWKMRLIKSVELYRTGVEKPWRVTLLLRNDGRQVVEITSPAADADKVRLKGLTKADYSLVLNMMMRAVEPDEIHQQIGRGWEHGV